MNPELPHYERDYQAALDCFCKVAGGAPAQSTIARLGARAVRLGLPSAKVLDLHTHALLLLLNQPGGKKNQKFFLQRGTFFYSVLRAEIDALLPDQASPHRKLKRMVGTLLTRTDQLAASNKKLQHEIRQRKVGEKLKQQNEKATIELLKKSLLMEDELRRLSRRLLLVQEEERKKISRELHDVIAQALAGINVRLAGLQTKSAAAGKELHQKIADTRLLVQKVVEIVHRFARDLRPSALDDIGFLPALRSHIRTLGNESKLRISLRATPLIEQLGMPEKTAFFRVIQESLHNVVQHAKATKAAISITFSKDREFHLCIRDNGRGFAIPSSGMIAGGRHLGLLGMRERIEMIGGTFSMQSSKGKFSAIRAVLPFSPPTAANPPRQKPIANSTPPS